MLGLEAVDNQANFEASVAGKNGVAVDFLQFKAPAVNEYDFFVEITNFGGWEFLLEIVEGSLGEISGNEEVRVVDEEVGFSLLNLNLEPLLAQVFVKLEASPL